MRRIVIASAAVATLVMLVAAGQSSALAGTSGGLWEVSGLPGGRAVRQCIANTRLLAQFEHRRESCPQTVIGGSGDATVVQYNCPSGGFGRSDVKLLTPRSLRIETQGISGGLPFHHVLQARRMGECPRH
jgi:hypothetical protein